MKSPKSLQVQITDKSTDSLWSWVVCVSSFLLQFLVGGFHCSFGTFFVALLDKFGRSEAETAWVGAFTIGLTYFCGPLTTHLCHRFGCRIVACTGSVLLAVSLFLTSIADNIMRMYLTCGVLGGVASSMLYFSSLIVLIQYFKKHLSLANGTAVSGVGVGTLTINTLCQYLISKYGLSMTFRVMAGFSAVAFFAGLAYFPLRAPDEAEKYSDLQKEEPVTAKTSSGLASKCKSLCKPGKQWQNKGFLVWVMAMSLILFAYYIPCMYLSKIAKDIGVPPSKASLLVGFMYISQSVGKLAIGKVAGLPSANRPFIFQLSLLVMAVAGCLLPLARSYSALVTYAVVQGFFDGSFVVLLGLITYDVVGKELMAEAVGSLNFVISIPMTLGPPVAGMFYDFLGNYNVVFFVSSGLVCVGICITFIVPWLTPPNLSTFDDKQVLLSIENDIDKCHEDDNRYDMSYVDEQKLADLLSRKRGINYLLERNRSQLDFSSVSRPSSFILFNIVSDEHPHDISAYTSRQELAFISGTNTPLRGTPGTARRRFNDVESHTSMYSLRQSFADFGHVETPSNFDCTEHTTVTLMPLPLETVEEVNEGERKISRQEKQSSKLNTEKEDAKEEVNEEEKEEVEEDIENLTAQGEERGSSSSFSDSDEFWKSSSQSTADTIDSGYVDYVDSSSSNDKLPSTSVWGDTNTRLSADILTIQGKNELSTDLVYHSYSCSDVTELTEIFHTVTNPKKAAWEVTNAESIDKHSYEESIDKHSYEESIDKHSYEESTDNSLSCYVYKNELVTSTELPHEDREVSICQVEPEHLCRPAKPAQAEDKDLSPEIIEVVDTEKESVEVSKDEDMFSSLFEDILELEIGGTEFSKSLQTNYSLEDGYLYRGKYRETVV